MVDEDLSTASSYMLRHYSVDLDFALQLGLPTVFTVAEAALACESNGPQYTLRPGRDYEASPSFANEGQFLALSSPFRNLVEDTMLFTLLLNNMNNGVVPKMLATEFYKSLLLLGYRIVQLRPTELCRETGPYYRRLHLGLTAFLLTCLQGPDHRIMKNELLSRMLLADIQQPSPASEGTQVALLWLLFIGAVAGMRENITWMLITRRALKRLGIKEWDEVKQHLFRFPWVSALHDPAGEAFWYVVLTSQLDGHSL